MSKLVIQGGTVVTATGSRRADVAVEGGRIVAIDHDLGVLAATADETIDATGLLILPGAIDVHTHARVATDAEPDRFFQDSVAAAFGGTTTLLAFNNPGTGSSAAAEGSLLAGLHEWRGAAPPHSPPAHAGRPALRGRPADPLAPPPARGGGGVAPGSRGQGKWRSGVRRDLSALPGLDRRAVRRPRRRDGRPVRHLAAAAARRRSCGPLGRPGDRRPRPHRDRSCPGPGLGR